MARASKPNVPTKSTGDYHYATEVNATDTAIDNTIDDYVSQTDTSDQTIASAVTFNGVKITEIKFGTASGTNPIVFAHGMGGTPKVICTANAAQPYAFAYSADATNVTIYHNAAGSLTFSYILVR